MQFASLSTIGRAGIAYRQPPAVPSLDGLRRMLAQQRQRRIDRAVARTMLVLDHPGIVADFRAARRG